MNPRLAVLVPTTGRPSLRATLESIRASWDGERVLVLAQGDDIEAAEGIFDAVDPRVWVDGKPTWTLHYLGGLSGGYGHDSRNYALDSLVGPDVTHVWSIDDDDIALPGALDALAVAARSDVPVTVFRVRWGAGHPARGVVKWERKSIEKGEIGTPMILHRRGVSRWGVDYFGDWMMAQALAAEFPVDSWAWDERVIAEIRPVA